MQVIYRYHIQGSAFHGLLFSTLLSVVDLSVNCHILKNEMALMRVERCTMYGYRDMLLVVGLILSPLIRIIVIVFPNDIHPVKPQVLDTNKVARYDLHFVKQAFYLTRKWLVTPVTSVPLLYRWACLARPVFTSLSMKNSN